MGRIPQARPKFIWIYKNYDPETKPRSSKAKASSTSGLCPKSDGRNDKRSLGDQRSYNRHTVSRTVDRSNVAVPLELVRAACTPRPHDICNLRAARLDPFNCTAVSIHSSSTGILLAVQSRLDYQPWGFCWGKPWTKNNSNSSQISGFAASFSTASTNPAHMASLLVFFLNYMRAEGILTKDDGEEPAFRSYAMRSIRNRLETCGQPSSIIAQDLLFDVTMLCLSAWLQNKPIDAMVHLKGSKLLVLASGGIADIPDYLREILLWVDYGISFSRLATPIFDPYTTVSRTPPDSYRSHPHIEEATVSIPSFVRGYSCFKTLIDVAESLEECVRVMNKELSRLTSSRNATWMMQRCSAIILHILAQDHIYCADQTVAHKKDFEVNRISLLLWATLLHTTGSSDVLRITVNAFVPEAVDSYASRPGYSDIRDALLAWNIGLNILTTDPRMRASGIYHALRSVAIGLEALSVIKLGQLFQRFFDLEDSYPWKSINGSEDF